MFDAVREKRLLPRITLQSLVFFAVYPLSISAEENNLAAQQASGLFRMTQFIEWDKTKAQQNKIICVLLTKESAQKTRRLYRALVNEQLNHDVQIRAQIVYSPSQTKECNLLFAYYSEELPFWLLQYSASTYHVVTVSDKRGFLMQGGLVALRVEGEALKLAVAFTRLRTMPLKVSSEFLKIAELH